MTYKHFHILDDDNLHTRFKTQCAIDGIKMTYQIKKLVEQWLDERKAATEKNKKYGR